MAGHDPTRPSIIAAALAATCALALAACGGDDDDDPVASGTRDDTTEATADAGAAADAAGDSDGDGAGPCDGFDETAVAAIVGDVVDTGSTGGEPTFGRGDGTEFSYAVEGCTFDVAVDGEDDPHVYSVSTGTALDAGIDVFAEFQSARDAEDVRPVDGLGDGAFVDATFGDQKVELIVRTGDTVLFVESDPPFGVPVAPDDVLVDVAELVIGETWATSGPGARPGGRQGVAEATKLAMSPSSVAHWVTPNATVSTPVITSAPRSDTGTRTGVSSPSGAGFIHISRATLA